MKKKYILRGVACMLFLAVGLFCIFTFVQPFQQWFYKSFINNAPYLRGVYIDYPEIPTLLPLETPPPSSFQALTTLSPSLKINDYQDYDAIIINNSDTQYPNCIYIGIIDPIIENCNNSAITTPSLGILSVIEKNGTYILNPDRAVSIIFNLQTSTCNMLQYLSSTSYYQLQSNLQEEMVNQNLYFDLPSITKKLIVEDGIIFSNGIQISIDNANIGNCVIQGKYGQVCYNLAESFNGYVNYTNTTPFTVDPISYYTWNYFLNYSTAFVNNIQIPKTLQKKSEMSSIQFSNKCILSAIDDDCISFYGSKSAVELNLQQDISNLFSVINFNSSMSWNYSFKNTYSSNNFYMPIPVNLPTPTQKDNIGQIVISSSVNPSVAIIVQVCNFPSSCSEVDNDFLANPCLSIRSILMTGDTTYEQNTNEHCRIYFNLNSTMCDSILQVEYENGQYSINYSTMKESVTTLANNPLDTTVDVEPSNLETLFLKDGLYFSNGSSIVLDNENRGNCILTTSTMQMEMNVGMGVAATKSSEITSSTNCSTNFGTNYNYCPDTDIYYCCGACSNTALCPSNAGLKFCACSYTSYLQYVILNKNKENLQSWNVGPNGIKTTTTSSKQVPYYGENYFSSVYSRISFYDTTNLTNGIEINLEKLGLTFSGSQGSVQIGVNSNTIEYKNATNSNIYKYSV